MLASEIAKKILDFVVEYGDGDLRVEDNDCYIDTEDAFGVTSSDGGSHYFVVKTEE